MPKKHIANHFAEWMKRIGERLSDLESNYKDLDSRHEELYSMHEELSGKVEDLESELAVADSRIDDPVYTAEGRKRKTLYGKTRAEVSEKLTKAMADRDVGIVYDAGKLTVGEYLERWLADSVKGSVKEATYANYSHFARKHICPALGRLKLKNLTPAHVRSFYGEKSRSGLSAATVKKMHVVLHRALSQAVTDGLIPATLPTA